MTTTTATPVLTRFPPSEVLELIFSNLEKTDLLNSRFVCKDWNNDCQSFFKKSKFRITLSDKEEWDGYVQLFPKPKAKPKRFTGGNIPVMPIHLKLKISDSEDEDIHKTDNAKKFEEFLEAIRKLQNLHGSECIRDLTLFFPKPYPEGFFENLQQILSDLSPGLEKLDISVDSEFPPTEGEDDADDWIILPKMKHLIFDWFNGIPFGRVQSWGYTGRNTAWRLVQACPNLETLVLGDMHEMDTQLWPTELPFPPAGIKTFDFDYISTDWLLKKMQDHPSLPALQKLKVWEFCIIGDGDEDEPKRRSMRQRERNLMRNDHDQDRLRLRSCREILRLFAPSLRSLSIPLIKPSLSNFVDNYVVPVPFPVFPALKNLKIRKHSVLQFNSNFKIDPASFPALESVSIPFDLILNENEDEEDEAEIEANAHTQFPTVKSLTLRFALNAEDEENDDDDNSEDSDEDSEIMENKFEYFQKLFPNICSVVFVNENYSEGLQNGIFIKKELKKFLQMAGPAAHWKIKEIKLIDFNQNYLGEVLQQILHPPRLVLENMERNPLLDDELLKTFKKWTHSSRSEELKIGTTTATGIEGQGHPEPKPDRCVTVALAEKDNSTFDSLDIRKIRLELTKEARNNFIKECNSLEDEDEYDEYRETIYNPRELYLDEVMTSFPNLEEIEVSSSMFASDVVDRAERIKRITEKFPELRINII